MMINNHQGEGKNKIPRRVQGRTFLGQTPPLRKCAILSQTYSNAYSKTYSKGNSNGIVKPMVKPAKGI